MGVVAWFAANTLSVPQYMMALVVEPTAAVYAFVPDGAAPFLKSAMAQLAAQQVQTSVLPTQGSAAQVTAVVLGGGK